METYTDKTGTVYKVVNGTYYSEKTPDDLILIMERHRIAGTRLIFHYGSKSPKEYWGDTETGRIGRSMGPCKVPLCIHNSRSMGGGALLLTGCILKIETSKGKNLIWVYKETNK